MNEIMLSVNNICEIWKEYIIYYPKKYYELIVRINEELLNLIRYIILKDKKKINISICMLDFFLELSYEKRIISENNCINLGNKLYILDYKVKEFFYES